jgi:hypothetical protein
VKILGLIASSTSCILKSQFWSIMIACKPLFGNHGNPFWEWLTSNETLIGLETEHRGAQGPFKLL